MNFPGKLTMNLSVFVLLCSIAGISYGASTLSERKKQIKNQERVIADNEKNETIEIGDDARLSDYIKAGLMNNPGLKAAFYKWKASFAKISQAFSLPDPQFTYTKYIEGVETRVGPQERAYSINQKFPLLDKLWIRRSKAFRASEESFYNLNKQRLEQINKITDAYYEYAYLSKAILLMNENIKLLKIFESVAQTKYRTGLAPNHDLLKVQVELGKLENDLLSLEDSRLPLVSRLNALLNLPMDNLLPWPDETLEGAVLGQKYEEINGLYDELTKHNPELLSLTENIEENRDSLKLAKREYFPDLSVGVTKIETADALNPGAVDSGKDPVMVMVSFNLPLWFGRLNAGVRESRASLKAAEELLVNKQNELLTRLNYVHYKIRDALRQSNLYKDALLPKATQTLNATQFGYQGGKEDFLSLIDAQRVLFNFQLAYYRQNANFYQRIAELKSLLGEFPVDPGETE
ncbi:TolC family protein [bacterium]|nr:TolC family protein [Candidatus Omnitrophota bacterium]MBU2527928.1 TolC family protein [bacterium]MBU3929281.1 TolC family protein [bacterium]MBU4122238.1 TolC family protein [bacterium]